MKYLFNLVLTQDIFWIGTRVHMYLQIENDRLLELRFKNYGNSITQYKLLGNI